MPIVRVSMWEGRTLDEKRRLARGLTDAITTAIGCDPATVRILIDEYPPEHWAIGGELQSDRERTSG